mmetsp:Transcript_99353/g.289977  ORF Transcript_99353/g.289977 Transcript_99353/m.289977 type:complete len:424 (-) Transcript_99353:1313-2584(-)
MASAVATEATPSPPTRPRSEVLRLPPQGAGFLDELRNRHLSQEDKPPSGADERRGVLVEPLIAQASLDDAVLLDLHALAHGTEGALNLISRELGISLRLEGIEEHVVERGDGLQRHGHDRGHLLRLEAEPDVAVAPDDEIVTLHLLRVVLDGCGGCLQDLVVSVGPRSLGVQGHGDDVRLDPLHQVQDGHDVALVRGLWREDVSRVEAEPQVRDVRQLPADVAPDALGLELAAGALQGLDQRLVLLAGVLAPEVLAQLCHAHEERAGVRRRVVAVDGAEVGRKAAGSTLVAELVIGRRDAVEELPDVSPAEVQSHLVLPSPEVVLGAEAVPGRGLQEGLHAVEQHEHVTVGNGIEATCAADKVVLVRSHARVPQHCRQVAEHNVVMMRLGVQELGLLMHPAALLNLGDQRVAYTLCQFLQRPP